MLKAWVYIGILGACSIAMLILSPSGAAFALIGGLAASVGLLLVDSAISNVGFARITWYAIRNWRRPIRISASYLFRIRVDDGYVLVWGGRFGGHFQPVGGVYKHHESATGRFIEFGVLPDSALGRDAASRRDLRLRLPGRHLVAWVRWFESGRNRELDAWREFYEELIATNILPQSIFPFIEYELIERKYNKLRYSAWAECKELLIADILEARLTEPQSQSLRTALSTHPAQLRLFGEEEIRRRGVKEVAASQPTQVSEHASWIL